MLYTLTTASLRSCRAPLRMAVSPPVMAVRATTGERNTKCRVWSPHANVHSLSSGLSTTQSSMPSKAVKRLHDRMSLTASETLASWPASMASEMFFTALIEIPKFVESENNLMVELKSDARPMPSGPRIMATNLLRTTPTSMFSP